MSRTIYNGPFVIPNQGGLFNNQHHLRNSSIHPLMHAAQLYPVSNSEGLSSAFSVVGEESCRPVYNLSFLDESAKTILTRGVPLCETSAYLPVSQTHLPFRHEDLKSPQNRPDVKDEAARIHNIENSDVFYKMGIHFHPNGKDLLPFLQAPPSFRDLTVNDGSTEPGHLQQESKKWRKAAHGYVWEPDYFEFWNSLMDRLQENQSFLHHVSPCQSVKKLGLLQTPAVSPIRHDDPDFTGFHNGSAESFSKKPTRKPDMPKKFNLPSMDHNPRRGPRKRNYKWSAHDRPVAPPRKHFKGQRKSHGKGRNHRREDHRYEDRFCYPDSYPGPPPLLPHYLDDDPRRLFPPFDDPLGLYPPFPPLYDYPLLPPFDPLFDIPFSHLPLPPRRRISPHHYSHEDHYEDLLEHENLRDADFSLRRDERDFTEDIDLQQSRNDFYHRMSRECGMHNGREYFEDTGQRHGRGQDALRDHRKGRGGCFPADDLDRDRVRAFPTYKKEPLIKTLPRVRGFAPGRGQIFATNSMGRGRIREKPLIKQSTSTECVASVQNVCKPVDTANMTMTEKLSRFILKLKELPERENAIQTIENCVTASHLPIKTYYVVEDGNFQLDNKLICSGALYINEIFIARATSIGKKSLKHLVYQNAIEILKSKTVSEIFSQTDPGPRVDQIPESAVIKTGKEPSTEDMRTKLLKLQEKIKDSSQSDSQPVVLWDAAFLESRCGLNHSYDTEPMKTERGVHMYTKTLILIEDQLLTSAIALSKKESKARACQKALKIFSTMDVDTILKEHFSKSIPQEEIPKEIQEMIKRHRERQSANAVLAVLTEQEVGDLLDKMISDLNSPVKEGVNSIMTIDKNCLQLKIKLLAVYKTVRESEEPAHITCDLYIIDRFIAQGKGTTRKVAQAKAYDKGAERLKKSTGLEVLTTFPQFDESELKQTDVMDIVYKGYSKMYESNLCRLNRLKQLPEEKRKISELIIMEHEDWSEDRKKHAHCILNQSATQCGCLLEWTTEPDGGCFRCTMKLQGEKIATAVSKQRKGAVGMASTIALFNLYESQPVIQGFHSNYPTIWIPRDKITAMAETLTENDITVMAKENKSEMDKKIATAIEMKLDQFFLEPTLKDFVCAPDWKLEEKRHLKNVANVRGLRVVADTYCEEQLPVISKKYDLLEMVKILENQPGKSEGRYRLLPEEEKPSYNDIAGEVAANESIIKKIQSLVSESGDGKQAEAEIVPEEPEEPEADNNMDISVDSDNEEEFFTANDTFVSDVPSKVSEVVTPTILEYPKLCDIPLPQETSTPAKVASKKEGNREGKKSKGKSSQSRWDKKSRTKTSKSSPVPSNVICGVGVQTPTLSKPPILSSGQKLENKAEASQLKPPPLPPVKNTPVPQNTPLPFLPPMNTPSPMQPMQIRTPSEPNSAMLSGNSWNSSSLSGNGSSHQFHAGLVDHQQSHFPHHQQQQQQNIDIEAGLPVSASSNSWSPWIQSNNLWQQQLQSGGSQMNHQQQLAASQIQVQQQHQQQQQLPTFPCGSWKLSCNYPSTFSTYDETR